MPRGKLIPIAENRSERIRNPPPSGLAADKVIAEVEPLELGVQPCSPTHVRMGVRKERLVPKIERIWQRCVPQNQVWASAIRLPAIRACRNLQYKINKPTRHSFCFLVASAGHFSGTSVAVCPPECEIAAMDAPIQTAGQPCRRLLNSQTSANAAPRCRSGSCCRGANANKPGAKVHEESTARPRQTRQGRPITKMLDWVIDRGQNQGPKR
jgi:hypothetical protein